MSKLSEYRAKMRNLILAEDTDEAFASAGYGDLATAIVTGSKSFRAARSVEQRKRANYKTPD